jgi:hypothetical protein
MTMMKNLGISITTIMVFLVVNFEFMLFGVNVVIVFHEKVPFNFGVPKKNWDSSRSRICELGI